MTFENGYTVSVQFGPNSVCSVKNVTEEDVITPSNIDIKVKDAEVAVVSPDKQLVPFRANGDSAKNFVSPEELVGILTWVMRRGTENEAAYTI